MLLDCPVLIQKKDLIQYQMSNDAVICFGHQYAIIYDTSEGKLSKGTPSIQFRAKFNMTKSFDE